MTRRGRFELLAKEPLLCRLADFGTADVDAQTRGQPINQAHLTTLENTPPDFLLLGTKATQVSAACAAHASTCSTCAPTFCCSARGSGTGASVVDGLSPKPQL